MKILLRGCQKCLLHILRKNFRKIFHVFFSQKLCFVICHFWTLSKMFSFFLSELFWQRSQSCILLANRNILNNFLPQKVLFCFHFWKLCGQFLLFCRNVSGRVAKTALDVSIGNFWGKTYFLSMMFTSHIIFGPWPKLFRLWLKTFGRVVKTAFHDFMGNFWGKNFCWRKTFFWTFEPWANTSQPSVELLRCGCQNFILRVFTKTFRKIFCFFFKKDSCFVICHFGTLSSLFLSFRQIFSSVFVRNPFCVHRRVLGENFYFERNIFSPPPADIERKCSDFRWKVSGGVVKIVFSLDISNWRKLFVFLERRKPFWFIVGLWAKMLPATFKKFSTGLSKLHF